MKSRTNLVLLAVVAVLLVAGVAPRAEAVSASGGNYTNDIPGYRIHVFTTNGTFNVSEAGSVEVLVVGGGGGGGKGYYGGGGGAGGLIYSNVYPVVAGSNYTVSVGGGGAGATVDTSKGSNGNDSSFGATLVAKGGGGGGSRNGGTAGGNANGADGGSGGGCGMSGSSKGLATQPSQPCGGFGNNGAPVTASSTLYGGGGGGAGAVAPDPQDTGVGYALGGPGGAGKAYNTAGASQYYAGGGGAGSRAVGDAGAATSVAGGLGGGGAGGRVKISDLSSLPAPTAGTANTGGGGGGSGATNDNGAAGGSGIVAVRYAFPNAWTYSMAITFTNDARLNTLTNFPALVIFDTSRVNYGQFQANGQDLRFMDGNGAELRYEVESWMEAGGASNSYIWVQIPTMTAGCSITAYWGNASATFPSYRTNGAVWADGYAAVWHMTSTNDSSPNAKHATRSGAGSVDAPAGKVAGAQTSTASSPASGNSGASCLRTPSMALGTSHTVGFWMKPTAMVDYQDPIGSETRLTFGTLANSNMSYNIGDGSSWGTAINPGNGTFTGGNWYYMVGTYGGGTNKLYKDGAYVNQVANTKDPGSAVILNIGARYMSGNNGYGFAGQVDEVRIASVVRSTNWVWAEYLNMASNTAFNTYGAAGRTVSDAPTIANTAVTGVTTGGAMFNGTLTSTGTSACAVGVLWGTDTTAWANTNWFNGGAVNSEWTSSTPFSTNVTLNSGATYFYTYMASNASGVATAASPVALITGQVTVEATDNSATYQSDNGTFTISRPPDLTNAALVVSCTINGTAVAGTDYTALASSVTLNPGVSNATLTVTPLRYPILPSTVVLTLSAGAYATGTFNTATVTVQPKPPTTYTSTQNGNWHAPATWGGSGYPNGGTDSAIISAGHTVTVAEAGTSYTVSNLTVNGVLTHTANSTEAATPYYKIDLTILGTLNVAGTGMINAKGKGFAGEQGPGKSLRNNYSASHGGLGVVQTTAGTTTYGSITNPTTLGSGSFTANAGGGAIRLNVSGAASIDGSLNADAADISEGYVNGTSGGSVNLTASTLSGGGIISANGASAYNGGGGGGRVAVKLTSGPDVGGVTLRAFGGGAGAAGTIYLQTTDPAYSAGAVIVNDGGSAPGAGCSTLISTNVSERQVATLIVTNSGVFNIASNVSFIVTSNFLNYAQTASLCANGGTFEVGGSGTMTFGGTVTTNRFYNFTCTNAGKRLVFPSGSSNRVDGVLKLEGAAGNLLVLESSGAGAWRLSVPSPSSLHSVRYVDVTNSDARGGATIFAYDEWVNRGGNSNWEFVAAGVETNTWTGGTSTDWGTAGNWSDGVPTDTHTVRVMTNNNPGFWPVLNDHTELKSLLLGDGAQMSLGTKNLTVNTNMVIAGTLIASGTETVTIKGDANWAGGAFTKVSSTVVIGGTGPQALDFSGIAFNKILAQNTTALAVTGSFSAVAFTNTGGPLTFTHAFTNGSFVNQGGNLDFGSGFVITNFYCSKSGVTNTFKNGATYVISNVTLHATMANRLVLGSSLPGAKWNLIVTGTRSVSGVSVADSDAGGGQTIRAVASVEGIPGSTVNWDFGNANWKRWTGAGTDFAASGNWSPAGIPGQGDSLIIESTNGISAPVLTNSLTVADLAIGGIGLASLTMRAPLTVTNRVTILQGGVITHPENGAVTDPVLSVDLTVGGDLVVAPGGAIDATAKGYADGPAPGNNWQWGGSHGGLGYISVAHSYTTYGSVTNPILPGSRGSFGGAVNEPGGGVVILRVTGDATVDGTIRADARSPEGSTRDGGSGGSVNLKANRLSGSGAISANSNTNSMHGGGGGGRVAVKLTTGTSVGNVAIQALGGPGSGGNGAPGTVYLQTGAQADGRGALIVDANGYGAGADVTTLISSNVTDAGAVGDVLIRNSAAFAMASNTAISVAGSWSNGATFAGASNSLVWLTGANTATVYGSNTFGMLVITGATKTVYFQAGKTNWVNGALLLRSATLRSTTDDTQWYVRLATGAQQNVRAVRVKDSNASGGQPIIARSPSEDLLNNINWEFYADPGSVFRMR